MQELSKLAYEYGVILIADEIQTGCGRTGNFFSFEMAGIQPDIICVSKSLSGFGLPLSINLIKPAIDCWDPGEHTGTFRGNNLAFITATSALDYWKDNEFSLNIKRKSRKFIDLFLSNGIELFGKGLMLGMNAKPGQGAILQSHLFAKGLLVDTCGKNGDVIKFLPPLTATDDELVKAFSVTMDCLYSVNSVL